MGAGFFLDVFVAFAIKSVMGWWGRRGTSRWPVVEGVVDSVEEERWYSVYVVKIVYHYEAEGKRRTGTDEINFFKSGSSYEFRRKVHPGMLVRLRVNPADAEASVIV